MCICCCNTRKSILIYMMIISLIAFIYGVIALTQFASNTQPYKKFITNVESIEGGGRGGAGIDTYEGKNDDDVPPPEVAVTLYSKDDLKDLDYSFIKSLKGIENGIGIVLFIFPLIFLIVEVVFFIFVWGDKEYKVLSNTLYKIFNIIKIVCIVLSVIFIILSLAYIALLAMAFVQLFFILMSIINEVTVKIIIGIVFGIYSFWFYINISCAFCKERNLFKNVGSVDNPGPNARIDGNGNQISGGVKPEGDQPQLYSDARINQN